MMIPLLSQERQYPESRKILPLNTLSTPLTSICIFFTSNKAYQQKETGLTAWKIVIVTLLFQ